MASVYYSVNQPEIGKPFLVLEFGSHPDNDADDCWRGDGYSTREEAEAAFAGPAVDPSTRYVSIEGPGVYRVRKNPDYVPEPADDCWRMEHAHQCGMAFGVQGFNDAMGW